MKNGFRGIPGKVIIIGILLFPGITSIAQPHASFTLESERPFINSLYGEKLGGISGMEYFNKDSILVISDRGKAYIMNSKLEFKEISTFEGTSDIESVRYHPKLHTYFYSYESNEKTGIRFLHDKQPADVFDTLNMSFNRGIEGITFASDGSLWAAFETSAGTDCNDSLVLFYRFTYDSGTTPYSPANKIAYEYPYVKCNCSAGKPYNGTYGNGVSEILASRSNAREIYVLERCYNGEKDSIALFIATIPKQGNRLTKKMVFNFNDALAGYPDKSIVLDNLEAMAWGKDEHGKHVLYVISDNNLNNKPKSEHGQENQLFILREK